MKQIAPLVLPELFRVHLVGMQWIQLKMLSRLREVSTVISPLNGDIELYESTLYSRGKGKSSSQHVLASDSQVHRAKFIHGELRNSRANFNPRAKHAPIHCSQSLLRRNPIIADECLMIINVNSSGVSFQGNYRVRELGMRVASRNAHNYFIVQVSTCVGNELQVSIGRCRPSCD